MNNFQFDENGNYIGTVNGTYDWLKNFNPALAQANGQPTGPFIQGDMAPPQQQMPQNGSLGFGVNTPDPNMNHAFGDGGTAGVAGGNPGDDPAWRLAHSGDPTVTTQYPIGTTVDTSLPPPDAGHTGDPLVQTPTPLGTVIEGTNKPGGVDFSSPTGTASPTPLPDPNAPAAPATPPATPATPGSLYPGDNKTNSNFQFQDGVDYSKVGAINWYDFQGNAYAQANANRLPAELDPNTGLKAGLNPQTLDTLVKQYGYQVGKLGYTDYNTAIRDLYAVGSQNPGTDFYLVPQTDGNWGIVARARTAEAQKAYGFTPPSMRPPAPPPGMGGGGGGRNVSRGTNGGVSGGVQGPPIQPPPKPPVTTAMGAQTQYKVPIDPNNPLNNGQVVMDYYGVQPGEVGNTMPKENLDYYGVQPGEVGGQIADPTPTKQNLAPHIGAIQMFNGINYQWNGTQWVQYGNSERGTQPHVVAG